MKAALLKYKVFLILHFSASLNDVNKPILCSILLRPYFKWRQKRVDLMGPLKREIHVAEISPARAQEPHGDKTNKGNNHFKWCKSFVCLVPVCPLVV